MYKRQELAIYPKQPDNGRDHVREVVVSIDDRKAVILARVYSVPELKNLLNVPLDYELELVKGGKFHPLTDNDTYKVHGQEEFLSHVRCGGSS